MFRKIVSHLPFSPSLISELAFYAKRLSKEETTRRLGLIFTALALVVQSLVVFSPPESANATSPNDMINGGIHSAHWLLFHFDHNTNNFRDVLTATGITRDEIITAGKNIQTISSTSGVYSWGTTPIFGAAKGEGRYSFKKSNDGGLRTFYYRPQHLWGKYNYSAFVGHSKSFGWFAIMFNCGNLITKVVPPAPKCPPGQIGTYPNCTTPPKKCTIPGKTTLNADDPNCKEDPIASCQSLNIRSIGNNYQLTADSSVANGAKVTSYEFKIYRGGKLIKTINSNSEIATYTDKTPGNYRVVLTVKTTAGDKTNNNCTKSFTIPEPAKCAVNPKLLAADPRCQPCSGDNTLWIEDSKCKASFIQTKAAVNLTQSNVDATKTSAKAHDRITYHLRVTNRGLAEENYTFTEDLTDIVQYATIFDTGGGKVATHKTENSTLETTSLTWPEITLKPGETQERTFTIQMNSKISSMGTGTSHPGSFDCRMDNTFGNTVSINVDCPTEKKVVETVVTTLPKTGAGDNMIFAGITLAVVTYFYARSRQLKKEVRIIRHNFNAGSL